MVVLVGRQVVRANCRRELQRSTSDPEVAPNPFSTYIANGEIPFGRAKALTYSAVAVAAALGLMGQGQWEQAEGWLVRLPAARHPCILEKAGDGAPPSTQPRSGALPRTNGGTSVPPWLGWV